jgi:hypothetical protein
MPTFPYQTVTVSVPTSLVTGGGIGSSTTLYGAGGGGSASTSGTGGWAGHYTTNSYNIDSTSTPSISVSGDSYFNGNVFLQGKNLLTILDKIQERLGIVEINAELEEKWEELKELGTRYRELEKSIMEQEKIWDLLKK